jgi:hypothetical protein
MLQLPTFSLSTISGGYYSSHRPQTTAPLAVFAPVFDNSHDLGTYDTEGGSIAPFSRIHTCHAVSPKNGDQNALGQQYSWGTWWDDDH